MDESAKQKLRELWQGSPEATEVLISVFEPAIDSLLTEAQAAALAMAADAVHKLLNDTVLNMNSRIVSNLATRTILALSPLNVTRYIERLRLEARIKEAKHWQKQIAHKIEFELVAKDRIADLERQLKEKQ